MNYTEDQLKAIHTRGCNLLVSAAAGSGKTGVLTERIVDRLRDGENIDELLVLTFTRAAAGEMKKRVREKILAAAAAATPDQKGFWSKQLNLLGDAPITTIHSFCLRLLRRHYNLLAGLDPKFRISDVKRAALLKQDLLNEYLEACYTDPDESQRERFFNLLRIYGSRLGDDGLKTELLRLLEFGCSQGDPGDWLRRSLQRFGDLDFWHDEARSAAVADLQMLIDSTVQDLAYLSRSGGVAAYAETLAEDEIALRDLKTADWEDLGRARPFARLKAKKKDDDPALAEYVKARRELRKKYFNDHIQPLFLRSFREYAAEISLVLPAMETLAQMTETFFQRYSAEKLKKASLDFSDLELYAARLLKENPALAKEYQNFFHEVLIDEYQDINPLQEEIITLLAGENKLFSVGDIKQSIYGFRLADHTLFLRRAQAYGSGQANAAGEMIFLNQNFRSQAPILDVTNAVFRRLMNVTVSQLSYGEQEALKCGAPRIQGNPAAVEMAVIVKPDADGISSVDYDNLACHGRFIADRIEKLMAGGFTVQDKEGSRPLRYGDITVLMRSANKNGEIIGTELANRGIPVLTPSSAGFLSGRETKLLSAFLAILDNPLQDIPLAAVMRSPLFDFSEDELMALALSRGKKKLWEMVLAAEDLCREGVDLEKAVRFRETVRLWRDYARIYPVGDLVDMFLKAFDYVSFWGGLPNGGRRMENIALFAEEAFAFQSDGGGLFDFLRYLEHLAASGGDVPAEGESGEDCVRVMNIHKSKGLEFPVVFLIRTEQRFNKQDLSGPLILNGDLGFGPNHKDSERRLVTATLPRLLIKNRKDRADLAEEMRVLYVALTRAREKLIITALETATEAKSAAEKVASYGAVLCFDDAPQLPAEMLLRDSSYYKWLLHAVSHPAGASALDCFALELVDALAPLAPVLPEQKRPALPAQHLERLRATLTRTLPPALPAKISVTSLLPKGFWEDDQVRLKRPKFMGEETTLSGAEKGTAFHAFMEQLPLNQAWDETSLGAYRDALAEEGILTAAAAAAVDLEVVSAFLNSPYGLELRGAEEVKRELSFVGNFTAAELFPGLDPAAQNRRVILQGAIDLIYRRDNGEWVLLDYKTNDLSRCGKEAFLAKYGPQMELYSAALKRIYDIDVAEGVFYLTRTKQFLGYENQTGSIY